MDRLVLIAALLAVTVVVYRRITRRGIQPPPGPPGLPLVGNVRDIPPPAEYPWFKYRELCRQYQTDILRLNALGTNIIVLDTLEAATELLDKRSAIYSDRPRMVLLNELAGFNWNFATMDPGDDWRTCRKLVHGEFHKSSFHKYRPILVRHAHNFLRRLVAERGARLPVHLKHLSGATILEITHDIKVLPENDPFIELAEAAQDCFAKSASGGAYLVDTIPILRYLPAWFPGAGFQREAAAWREKAEQELHIPYQDFMQRYAAGKAGDCVAKSLAETYGTDEETALRAKMAASTMYLGGAETTAAALHSFFLAMLLHPEIQARARRELVTTLGSDRLPTFEDFSKVPYIDALIKEVFRWCPVVPLVLPHKLRKDDIYRGYYLQKDSLVIANTWSILHDESIYTDPFTFNPDRFLSNGVLNPDVPDPANSVFGFGRRVCAGQYMAYDTLWITIASFLACLEIEHAKDSAGKVIEVKEEFASGLISEPKPFPCHVRFLSEAHAVWLAGS